MDLNASTLTRDDFLAAVRNALLNEPYSLTRVSNVGELFANKAREPRQDCALLIPDSGRAVFRAARELDVEADGVIVDHALGSIGLLHWLQPDSEEEPTEAFVREQLDRAAYLRHLLTQRAETNAKGPACASYCVEVVFVIGGGSTEQALGTVLQKVMRDSAHAHSVGINVWRPEGATGLASSASVRRAFSWLLVHVRAWLKGLPRPANGIFHHLSRLNLTHFRVAGNREWWLDQDEGALPTEHATALHIVHGHNGSGKSSLGEAIELLVTGKVDRIKTRDHREVLRCMHVEATEEAVVLPVFRGDAAASGGRTIVKAGIDSPLSAGCAPSAFRMDQQLGDRLSQREPAERARIILEAFFPEDDSVLKRHSAIRQRLNTAAEQLPPRWKQQLGIQASGSDRLDPAQLRSQMRWLATPKDASGAPLATEPPLPLEKLAELLPIPAKILDSLSCLLDPSATTFWRRTTPITFAELVMEAPKFDAALQTLLSQTKLSGVISDALRILQTFGHQLAAGENRGIEELPDLLNDWLECLALDDLLTAEERILATVSAAAQANYKFPVDAEPLLKSIRQHDITQAADVRKLVKERLREARDTLDRVSSVKESAAGGAPLASLEGVTLEVLDDAAKAGAFGSDLRNTQQSLSGALREAIQARRIVHVTAGGKQVLRVGAVDWANPLIENARQIKAALDQLATLHDAISELRIGVGPLLRSLRQAVDAASDLAPADNEVVEKLRKRLSENGPLPLAMNELIALMTPARWSYEDLISETDIDGAAPQWELNRGNLPGYLRLNTAELNSLALALFLLGAPASPNPLRLILLDDPLQNMDELTVVTVSRALARLLRAWAREPEIMGNWRLVILLHGEENVERMRQEAAAVTHFLPWLSPRRSGVRTDGKILRESPRFSSELQPLHEICTERP